MQVKTLEAATKLFEHYENTHKIQHYYGLLAYFALSKIAILTKSEPLIQKCVTDLSRYQDKTDHPNFNFDNYRFGGNGKAWLLMHGHLSEELDDLREFAELTYQAPCDSRGIICMPWDQQRNLIWIDVVTCVTPFMLFAGLTLKEEKYIDFAAEQALKMYHIFLDKECGLLHQSRGFTQINNGFSQDHWSRGNGWGFIGLAELLEFLPKENKYYEEVRTVFKDFSQNLIKYQGSNGLWNQELTEASAWAEASGTALILYCIGVGLRNGVLSKEEYGAAFELGIKGLAKHCVNSDYSTLNSCPGCLCPGEGDEKGTIDSYINLVQPQKDEVHSFGSIMLAFYEAHRNGIEWVEL